MTPPNGGSAEAQLVNEEASLGGAYNAAGPSHGGLRAANGGGVAAESSNEAASVDRL